METKSSLARKDQQPDPSRTLHSLQNAADNPQILQALLNQLAKVGFLCWLIAWALSSTSKSFWLNIPLAGFLIASGYWLFVQVSDKAAEQAKPKALKHAEPAAAFAFPTAPPSGNKSEGKWKEQVNSPMVVQAWETLSGSIVQEFVYDLWWGHITPDTDFPKDIRRVLNSAFGELAARAQHADLKRMLLTDVSDLLQEQIELYRSTKQNILQGLSEEAFTQMTPQARERALLQEMKSEGNLHPALYPHEKGQFTGHYKVLRHMCEGLVALLMDRADYHKFMMRSVARDLLASLVFRPIMQHMTPYNINKVLLSALQERRERKALDVEEAAVAAAAAASAQSSKHDPAKGQWNFAQRAQRAAQAEEQAAAAGTGSLRSGKKGQHQRHGSASDKEGTEISSNMKRLGSMPRTRSATSLNTAEQTATHTRTFPGDAPNPSHQSGMTHQQPGMTPQVPAQQHRPDQASGPDSSDGEGRQQQPSVDMSRQGSRGVPSGRAGHVRAGSVGEDSARDYVMGRGRLNSGPMDNSGTPGASSSQQGQGPMPQGTLKAKVVAADSVRSSDSLKEVVVYKIRAADVNHEWTVSRRYSNFEQLHRQLRDVAAYRLKLPPKRLFVHNPTPDFVEERRQQLDTYLQMLLQDPQLQGCVEVAEFLKGCSDLYDVENETGFFKSLGASVANAKQNMERVVGDMVDDMDMKRKRSVALVTGRTDAETDMAPPRRPLQAQRSRSSRELRGMQEDPLRSAFEPPTQALPPQALRQAFQNQGRLNAHPNNLLVDTAQNLFSKGFKNLNSMKNALQGREEPQLVAREHSDPSLEWSRRNPPYSAATTPANSLQSTPASTPKHAGWQGQGPFGEGSVQQTRQPDSAKPSRFQRDAPTGAGPETARSGHVDRPEHSAGSAVDAGHLDMGNLRSNSTTLPQSSGTSASATRRATVETASAPPYRGDADAAQSSGLDAEENMGISSPLYQIIDVVFDLRARGFLRRQAFGVARQMLSLVAGSAIDEYLLSQMRLLRQPHTLARIIHALQTKLWPGGVWFQHTDHYHQTHQPGSPDRRRPHVTAEHYTDVDSPPPLDEEEIQEAVYSLLINKAPPVLVRLIGRDCYKHGVDDLFEMIQSRTFIYQLGYGIIKIFVVNVFAELRPLFRQMELSVGNESRGVGHNRQRRKSTAA